MLPTALDTVVGVANGSTVPLIDIDWTVLIQAGLFGVMFLVGNKLLFQPYLALREPDRDVAPRDFHDRQRAIAEAFQVGFPETDADAPAVDGRPRRDGAFVSHRAVHGVRRLEVVRRRQAL